MDILEYEDLEEGVFDSIIAMLLEGSLKPGDKLNQLMLARSLNASRTPINAVLSHLEALMIVEKSPRRGYFVPRYPELELKKVLPLFSQNCRNLLNIIISRSVSIRSWREEWNGSISLESANSAVLIYTFIDSLTDKAENRFLKGPLMSQVIILLVAGRIYSADSDETKSILDKSADALGKGNSDAAIQAFEELADFLSTSLFATL